MCAAARVEGIHSAGAFAGHLVHQMAENRRTYERLPIAARVRVTRISGKPVEKIGEFEALDISCGGLRFRAQQGFVPGAELDMEVVLLERRRDGSAVRMFTSAVVIRSESLAGGASSGVSVAFTDIQISRDAAR